MASPLQLFAWAFIMVFISELGDKTQMTILALGLRGRRGPVLAGSILAFCLVNGLSSALGLLIHRSLPIYPIRLASASIFMATGALGLYRELRAGERAGKPEVKTEAGPSFLKALVLVGLAELGDKTQLVTLGFSATTGLAALVALASISALTSMALATCLLASHLGGGLKGLRAGLISYGLFLATGVAMLFWII
ncbi:hypothetical protein DRO32_00645 [Candidatus Bathyarchaeota archaeon]|nr:MAG: hypothetical protein DRO32_00645 [Candidatus Bathyarchaeota archaeon]